MTEGDAPRSFLQKACENCRLRKIRCDKRIPCASCQTLGIACQAATPRTVEHRPRVVVTSQYERQISLIQERLHAIEISLKQLSQSPLRNQHSTPNDPVVERRQDKSIAIYEGDSSFGKQTIQASQLADLTATTVLGRTSDELATALSSLKDSLKQHETLSRLHEAHLYKASTGGAFVNDTLPPAALVVSLINRAKILPPFSLVAFAWRGISQLESLCQRLYFPLEPLSTGSTTLFYGLMYYIVRDYLSQDDHVLDQHDGMAYLELCESKFCAGLETFELLTVPVLENIQALLLGATKAQEECKLSLCWTFIGAASTMCHTLGYHRRSSLGHEDAITADIKRHVFWQLYMLDKNLSLNLGRSSNFQDIDIDADYFTPSSDPKQLPWDMMSLATISFARVQGQVYDKLYSASALKSPIEDRSHTVDELSSELRDLRDQLVSVGVCVRYSEIAAEELQVDVSNAYYYERLQGMVDCADFISYSVLTIMYRAQPVSGSNTEISFSCYEAARLSLESHLRCFAQFRDRDAKQQSEYVNWILLYPSFTPFTVVFIRAIATTDTAELLLLQETVSSLNHIKALSPAARRLHDVCAAFLRVAIAFVNSQRTLSGWHCREDGSLSLPPSNAANWQPDWTALTDMDQTQDQDLSTFLCHLAANNRPMTDFLHMDLLDSDLGYPGS